MPALYPLRGAGAGEILLAKEAQEWTAALGARVRGMAAGRYTMSMTSLRGGEEVTVFTCVFSVRSQHTDWIVPPRQVTVMPGDLLSVTITRDERQRVYQSAPIRIRAEEEQPRHRFLLGAVGSRVIDLLFAGAVGLMVAVPFAVLAWYTARRIRKRFPELAAERARLCPRAMRFLAPAFFRDTSRWVYRNGKLEQGNGILKLETLTPNKRPLFGHASLFLRHWGLDELPQLLAIWRGEWSALGPRAVPNRDGLVAPGGGTVQNSRDVLSRYEIGGVLRKPGVFSLRVAMTPRGSIELPPWQTMLLYDRYDSVSWSVRHTLAVMVRLVLAFLWSDGLKDHLGPAQARVIEERDCTAT